jgi:hypothetical protein
MTCVALTHPSCGATPVDAAPRPTPQAAHTVPRTADPHWRATSGYASAKPCRAFARDLLETAKTRRIQEPYYFEAIYGSLRRAALHAFQRREAPATPLLTPGHHP